MTASSAHARQQPVRRLAELTSRDVADLVAAGDLTAILPLGAIEQHGPHLPLATDVMIAEAIAERLADADPSVVVCPTLVYGDSAHHSAFAGTVAIPRSTLTAAVRAAVDGLLASGFARVAIITGHAGNCPSMLAAVHELADERVVAVADWPSTRRAIHEVAMLRFGFSASRVGTHAGHFETSVMLLLRPDLVRVESAPRGAIGEPDELGSRLGSEGMLAVSPVGVIGDATGATAEAGSLYLDALVEFHAAALGGAHR